MLIGAVDYNMAMTRPQDLAVQKHNEDNKGMVDHAVFQNEIDKNNDAKTTRVNVAQDTDTRQRQKDAKDKGSNEYDGDGGARRRDKDEIPVEGRVIRKSHIHFESGV